MAPPLSEKSSLVEVIAGRQPISRINATFSVIFEKIDSEIRGEGTLQILYNGDLDLKVYTLGFLAMELTSRNGVVKSNPRLDSAKKAVLTDGLRDCFFWWNIKDFTVQEQNGHYLLRNTEREVMIDKENILPKKQHIYYPNGKVLTIDYYNPAVGNSIPYQSKMKINLSKYSVTLMIKNIHFETQVLRIDPQVNRNSLYRDLVNDSFLKEKPFKKRIVANRIYEPRRAF